MKPRRAFRAIVVAALTGVLTVSVAWAGAGLAPLDPAGLLSAGEDVAVQSDTAEEQAATVADAASAVALEPGQVLAGAAKVNIAPKPAQYGGTWEKQGCATMDEDAPPEADHFADFRVRWPEKPNCLYMGGYGIGPMNPITSFDGQYGLWARSVAISDGTDTIVLTLLDGAYYFGDYNSLCDNCGAFQIASELGAELGIDPAGFFIVSTHSHTSPDFIGGWGGVPAWYMQQVNDAIRTSVRQAVAKMEPAVVEVGETLSRRYNSERRDFYRSAEDSSLAWMRLYPLPVGNRVIATVGAYAAHPVTEDEEPGVAHADFPGVFEKEVEKLFSGIGFFFQTGLGNESPRGNSEEMGKGLASLVPPRHRGTKLADTDIRVAQEFWDQPVTNSGLTALGVPGFFDRPFAQKPAVVDVGKSQPKTCRSASPVSVNTAVNAARIGPVVIAGAPGETFANFSNTIEERTPSVSFPLALANDGLGYIMQSFETDHVGRQAVGFVGEVAEYEDAYSIDHCFGDAALEKTLALIGGLFR